MSSWCKLITSMGSRMGDEGAAKPSVSIDVSFGAKANFEVKAEIPKEQKGALVAALTDVIRPFTEKRGLKADQIRLQREDVLLEIAKKARAWADIEHLKIQPVPMKLLVPLLEKASLEDQNEDMRDIWASLLLSASCDYQARHLSFVDILSRLTSRELRVLAEIAFSFKGSPEATRPNGHMEQNLDSILSHAHLLQPRPSRRFRDNSDEAYQRFIDAVDLTYGRIMYAMARSSTGDQTFKYCNYGASWFTETASVEILAREALIKVERVAIQDLDIGYCQLTHLGVQFLRDCSPRAPEMAARRAIPTT
jgi:hypothetical protein